MRTINKRILVVVIAAVVMLLATDILMWSMFSHAEEYALHSINDHLFDAGVLKNAGNIIDKNGMTLATSVDGERIYADDSSIRKALLHVIGDDAGFIDGGLQDTFRKELCGYSVVYGINQNANNSIRLTLDAKLCGLAYDLLDGYKGCVGVQNYKTGEIVCLASSRSYDIYDKPTEAIEENEDNVYDGIYINRLFGGLYTPGSVFKCVTAMAALENLDDPWDMTFYCDGTYHTADGDVICHDVHGEVTFREALNQSCNVAFAQIAERVGLENLNAAFVKAGLDRSVLTTDRIRTVSGMFNPGVTNPQSELGWAGIGQSTTLVNPYAFLNFMCAIANGGTCKQGYFVNYADDGNGKKIYETQAVDSEIALNPDTASDLRDLLRSDVSDYYGDDMFGDVTMCGKTGTAEKDNEKSTAWFAGFSNEDDFPYAIVVVVEDSGGGLTYAAPIASRVLNELYYSD